MKLPVVMVRAEVGQELFSAVYLETLPSVQNRRANNALMAALMGMCNYLAAGKAWAKVKQSTPAAIHKASYVLTIALQVVDGVAPETIAVWNAQIFGNYMPKKWLVVVVLPVLAGTTDHGLPVLIFSLVAVKK